MQRGVAQGVPRGCQSPPIGRPRPRCPCAQARRCPRRRSPPPRCSGAGARRSGRRSRRSRRGPLCQGLPQGCTDRGAHVVQRLGEKHIPIAYSEALTIHDTLHTQCAPLRGHHCGAPIRIHSVCLLPPGRPRPCRSGGPRPHRAADRAPRPCSGGAEASFYLDVERNIRSIFASSLCLSTLI